MKRIYTFTEFLNESNNPKLEILKNHFNRTNKSLAKWIIDNLGIEGSYKTEKEAIKVIKAVDSHKYYDKLPSMYFFDSPAHDLPEGEWLIHFTKRPEQILKSGFNRGTPDYLKIGMSWGRQSIEPGYNYAFRIKDVEEKYGSIEAAAKFWKGTPIYFKAPAIVNYHFGDEIDQVIFWGPDAKDFTLEMPK